jgi:hypothetical protein
MTTRSHPLADGFFWATIAFIFAGAVIVVYAALAEIFF